MATSHKIPDLELIGHHVADNGTEYAVMLPAAKAANPQIPIFVPAKLIDDVLDAQRASINADAHRYESARIELLDATKKYNTYVLNELTGARGTWDARKHA